jgi:hypothetical protein
VIQAQFVDGKPVVRFGNPQYQLRDEVRLSSDRRYRTLYRPDEVRVEDLTTGTLSRRFSLDVNENILVQTDRRVLTSRLISSPKTSTRIRLIDILAGKDLYVDVENWARVLSDVPGQNAVVVAHDDGTMRLFNLEDHTERLSPGKPEPGWPRAIDCDRQGRQCAGLWGDSRGSTSSVIPTAVQAAMARRMASSGRDL